MILSTPWCAASGCIISSCSPAPSYQSELDCRHWHEHFELASGTAIGKFMHAHVEVSVSVSVPVIT